MTVQEIQQEILRRKEETDTCILAHAFVNATSVIAVDRGVGLQLTTAAVQSVMGVVYGLWLLRVWNKDRKETADGNSDH